MTIRFLRIIPIAVTASMLMFASGASGTVIYNDSVNDISNRFNPGTLEVGDEIILAGTARILTNFSFEYWGLANGTTNGSFTITPEVQLKFYLNNGPLFNGYPSPTNAFYTSGWFGINSPTDRSLVEYNITDFGGGLYLPVVSNMTWSVQFRNIGVNDTLGVDIFDPPSVGQAINDYWEFSGSSWSLKTNIVNMNFAAKMEATVPEPSTMVFAILGGLGLLVVGRCYARK